MISKDIGCLLSFKKLTIAVVLCLQLLILTAHADEKSDVWSRMGPEGANINQLVMSRSHPAIIYAATQSGTYYSSSNEYILKSINSGASWVTLPWQGMALNNDTITAHRTHQHYSSFFYQPPALRRTIAVASSDADVVFTSLSGFVLKTSDSGMHWHSLGTDIKLDSASFFLMNTSVRSSTNLMALSGNDIVNSKGGEHWVDSNKNINTNIEQIIEPSALYQTGESNIHLLTADPENNAILYGYTKVRHRSAFVTQPVFLYKSLDQGETWQNITPSGYRFLGNSLVFDADNSKIMLSIFSKTNNDVFYTTDGESLAMFSRDGGLTWQALGVPSTETTAYNVTHLYLDPIDKTTLYARLGLNKMQSTAKLKVLAKSVDAGKSWEIMDTSPYVPGDIAIDPENNSNIVMASPEGILRSENGGHNWMLSNKGIRHIGGKLSIAQDNNQVMYLAGNDPGDGSDNHLASGVYYKSSDGGQHWETLMSSAIVTGHCREFKINPKDNQDVFCLTDENIYQSKDAGKQWVLIKQSNSHQLIRANDGVTVYLSDPTGTSKSEDNGVSWHSISSLYEGELSIHPDNQSTLYYLLDNRLFSSTDGGMQWHSLEVPNNIAFQHLLIHPLNPDIMVLYSYYGYALSQDGGNNWHLILETLNNGNTAIDSFPAEFDFISQIVLNPTDTNGLFLKTNKGIFVSSDQGAHWSKRNANIESHVSGSFTDLNLLTSANDVYVDSATGIFKYAKKVNFTAVAACLFNWAEQANTDLFAPVLAFSEQWHGYTFRYYSVSNTYIGIFHEQEVHQLQPDISSVITAKDSMAFYQNLSGCPDTLF